MPSHSTPGKESFLDAAGKWDDVVVESPLMIEIGESRLLNFRTPGHDEDLVRGFLLSEGLVTATEEIESIHLYPSTDGQLDDRAVVTLKGAPARTPPRYREIRPSCGACGDEALAALRPLPLPVVKGSLTTQTLIKASQQLTNHQPLFKTTGGCHAAALASLTGEILVVAEDVGRHNAVDKVIGMAMRQGLDRSSLILILSGRAGYELVAKAIRVGIGTVVSVSAATSLSLRAAKAHGLTLAGFCRDGKVRVYHDVGRMIA